MGRTATHSVEALLAAAAGLFASGGARALTMSAVARTAGAPSGSVYHRFPDRPALLAAVWVHTVRKFQDEYLRELGARPTPDDAVRAAEWIVDWCRRNPASAAVLQAGVHAFEPESWSAESTGAFEAVREQQAREIKALVASIATQAGLPADQAQFALFDLPLAVVRPYLIAGRTPPPKARTLVRELAARILKAPGPADATAPSPAET
ncbi:TetR/AcrR family transcriptional regulator [Nocardia sp. NPDC050717]|uniref:TetR/AcrR family transcriptional regulator n=1 Tax=Nocardia sp. NPDC050717 TaxID=3157221 RepID=UPI0033C3993F